MTYSTHAIAERICVEAHGQFPLPFRDASVDFTRDSIEAIFSAQGVDIDGRAAYVENLRAQRDAAARINKRVISENEDVAEDKDWVSSEEKNNVDAPGNKLAEATAAADEVDWVIVQWFETAADAVDFVRKCQPFDYERECEEVSDAGEETREPEQVYAGNGIVYLCTSKDYVSRRLRVRYAPPRAQDKRSSVRRMAERIRKVSGRASDGQGNRAWVVERAGNLFNSNEHALRNHPVEGRSGMYYIAVPAELSDKILSEGYHATLRTSIPCAASIHEAMRLTKSCGDKSGVLCTRHVCLTVVSVPKDVLIIAHKSNPGAFLLKTRFLPPECFSKRKSYEEKKEQPTTTFLAS
eukprot:GEMP01038990.1.p1 GENE.GEMP01038990.1~~GEMP01038990.1.p1  ORF type:complete len:352 (+),score=75.33 GEMP01038990.1:103-1158(+)